MKRIILLILIIMLILMSFSIIGCTKKGSLKYNESGTLQQSTNQEGLSEAETVDNAVENGNLDDKQSDEEANGKIEDTTDTDNSQNNNNVELDEVEQNNIVIGDSNAIQKEEPRFIVGIDPGHQQKANHDMEPIAPGSSKKKYKVSSGTRGIKTKIYEYEVNLEIGLALKDKLVEENVEVVMTRETHEVDISNSERAVMMNEADVDLVLRLHCDGSNDQSATGAFMLIPASGQIFEESKKAALIVLDEYIEETKLKNRGIIMRGDITGFNWSEVPVILIEMGYMTNPDEDVMLSNSEFQTKMVTGLKNGIMKYLNQLEELK